MTGEGIDPQLGNLAAMQDGRHQLVEHAAQEQLQQAFNRDRINYPGVTLADVKADGATYTMYDGLYANELLGCEAVGVDVAEILKTRNKNLALDQEESLPTAAVGGTQLEISVMRDRCKFRIAPGNTLPPKFDEYDTPAGLFKDAVSARFAASPAHQALQQAQAILKQMSETPKTMRTSEFDPHADPLGTLAFMEDIGAASYLTRPMLETDRTHVLDAALSGKYGTEVVTTETADGIILNWGKGSARQLVYNRQTGNCYYEVTQDPDYFYPEAVSKVSGREDTTTPFIETTCAAELTATLEAAGLMFNPILQANMMTPHAENSMGSIYTELSRELAKGIDRPERLRLSNLFVPFDAEQFGTALADKIAAGKIDGTRSLSSKIHDINDYNDGVESSEALATEATVRELWQSVAHQTDSESASVLFTMIDDVLQRPAGEQPETGLPVTAGNVEFNSGACGDVATYYIRAANRAQSYKLFLHKSIEKSAGLHQVVENGVAFLQKTKADGNADRYLSVEPMVFNGVRLPKGALFTKNEEDGGWAFLRLTAFAFDKPEDQIAAAGSEIPDKVRREQEFGSKVGGITLSRFVELAVTSGT